MSNHQFFSASTMAECKVGKIIDINCVHVKPKYLLHYIASIPKGAELFAKHGGKLLGVWMTEAGGEHNPEIVYVAEWGK